MKEWQKPGDMQAGGSPSHPVPAHPGASDDSESDEDASEEVKQEKPTKLQTMSKPIENLVEDVEDVEMNN